MFESIETPIDTMMPTTPDRVSASPRLAPSQEMIAHMSPKDSARLAMATAPKMR